MALNCRQSSRAPVSARPAKLEIGKRPRELGEVGLVRALIGAAARLEHLELATGHRCAPTISASSTNLVVQLVGAGVERLVVDCLDRRLEHGHESARHVFDVDDRAPRLAVAVHHHFAGCDGRADQIVQHGVEAHPRREAVDRAVAQEGRREPVAGQLAKSLARRITLERAYSVLRIQRRSLRRRRPPPTCRT